MYRDEILDLYKNPLNIGSLDTEFEADGENPSCGDHTHIYIEVEDDKIVDVKHETDGCAISTAAISIASDELKGMKVEEVKALERAWMIDLMGIEVSPMRVKCAILGLKTVQKALTKCN
jgi:nitrogen fixation NifU-like protein